MIRSVVLIIVVIAADLGSCDTLPSFQWMATKQTKRRFGHSQQRQRRSSVGLTASKTATTNYNNNNHNTGGGFRPIPSSDSSAWPNKFPAKEHCSKCGLCETSFISRVKDSCAFLGDGMGRIDRTEVEVHGRGRQNEEGSLVKSDKGHGSEADEARFGVLYEPMRLVKAIGMEGAQWTGCVTSIAVAMLESGMVDAVVCIAADDGSNGESQSNINDNNNNNGWSTPEPILAKTTSDVLKGRGVKPALAPSLRVLDEIRQDSSIRKLLFCGVGCAVQAFRAIQHELALEQVYVLGTNCADNSPTPAAAQAFIEQGLNMASTTTTSTIHGYEFMPDFRVHVKKSDGYTTKPYFCLPGSIAKASIAPSCLACFDYTNALADVVVGYMGAPYVVGNPMTDSYQTLTVRNARGAEMVQAAMSRLQLGDVATGRGRHYEGFAMATVQSDSIVQSMIGNDKAIPQQGMPLWMGEVMAFAMTALGPKGVNFARYSIDYHILRNYLHVLSEWGEERSQREQLPQYSRDIVQHYRDTFPTFNDLISKVLKARETTIK